MTNLKPGYNESDSLSGSDEQPESNRKMLGGRIRAAREALGISRNEASSVVSVSLSTFQAWESGDREPDATKLSIYAKRYHISADWLLFGEGAMFKQMHHEDAMAALPACVCHDTLGNPIDLEEFVFVPRYNLKAAAGHGAATDGEKAVFSMAFRKYWITNYLHADPKDLSVISVKGDSMEGVLNNRDVILINHADKEAVGGMYVLRIDGSLVVKRVQLVPGSKLKVSSANEAYVPFEVDLQNPPTDFSIIGRVVWFGRQI